MGSCYYIFLLAELFYEISNKGWAGSLHPRVGPRERASAQLYDAKFHAGTMFYRKRSLERLYFEARSEILD